MKGSTRSKSRDTVHAYGARRRNQACGSFRCGCRTSGAAVRRQTHLDSLAIARRAHDMADQHSFDAISA